MYTTDKKVEINEHYTPQKKKKNHIQYIYNFFFLYKMTNNIFVCK